MIVSKGDSIVPLIGQMNSLISWGLDGREIKVYEVDIMLEENVLNFSGCRSLNREVCKSLVDFEYRLIELFDLGSEMTKLEVFGWILHSEFKPAL